MNWFKRKKKEVAAPTPEKRRGLFSTDLGPLRKDQPVTIPDFKIPAAAGASMAMDGVIGQPNIPKQGMMPGVPESLMGWYIGQSFIGYPACAIISQHWLVEKACWMPARDAIRQGYILDLGDEELSEKLRKTDERYELEDQMRNMIGLGRVYGVRAVLFDVLSTDPDYYEKPFNLDGVMPGCYRGLVQIDPQWISPLLTNSNVNDPAHRDFLKPTFFMIGGRQYHRSHLHFYIPYPVPAMMLPTYQYGGVSVPQRVYERVYAAERTANEAPQLAMTKRTTSFQASEGADLEQVEANMERFSNIRDNYGVMVHGPGEAVSQMDTGLADFDALVMTQYQLVAAQAETPATRLLGTQPKGFNATGEYEESMYREKLESTQSNDLDPLLQRHYAMVAKSRNIELESEILIQWAPLDSPTAGEWATINKTKAETDKIYFDMQAIDGADVRNRIREDREGDYYGLAEEEIDLDLGADPLIYAETEVDLEANPANP